MRNLLIPLQNKVWDSLWEISIPKQQITVTYHEISIKIELEFGFCKNKYTSQQQQQQQKTQQRKNSQEKNNKRKKRQTNNKKTG